MTSFLFFSTLSLICFKPPFFLPPFRWYHILTRFLSSFLWHLPLSSHLDPVIHHLLFSIKSLLLEPDIWDTVSVLSSFLNVLFLTPFTLLNLFSCFFSPFETKPSLACGSFYNVVCFLPSLKSFIENALHVVSGCRALTHVHLLTCTHSLTWMDSGDRLTRTSAVFLIENAPSGMYISSRMYSIG